MKGKIKKFKWPSPGVRVGAEFGCGSGAVDNVKNELGTSWINLKDKSRVL